MIFHCTLVRGPGSSSAGLPLELTIDAPPNCAGEDLQREIAQKFATQQLTLDGFAVSGMTLGEAPLVTGAVLVDGGTAAVRSGVRTATEPPASLLLAVQSGPGSGTVLPLRRGTYRIGRSNSDVNIPDADLSRQHAQLEVSDTAVTIVDLDSTNGTQVDGKRVRNAIVSTGTNIRCGNSTMSLVFGGANAAPMQGLQSAGKPVAEPLTVNRRTESGNRTALIVTAVLPLLIGVGLAVVTGMWMFLAFTSVSAISILVPVLSGRRQRRELKAAVTLAAQKDRERRRRSAPSAADIVLCGPVQGTEQIEDLMTSHGVWLRLGLAKQLANICFEPADPNVLLPALGFVPLTLDPATPITSVRGPQTAVNGLANSIIMQLGGYPAARGTRVLIHGQPELLPLAARYLDTVTLSADIHTTASALQSGPGPGNRCGLLMIMGNACSAIPDAKVIEEALSGGWQVIAFGPSGGGTWATDIELGENLATFHSGTSTFRFVPDLVPEEVFDRQCRRLAMGIELSPHLPVAVPESCSLDEVVPLSTAAMATRWAAGRLRSGLPVPIGLGACGPRLLDLVTDGPHLLVAGTTGSGKSELLRSLTAALALSYPPDRINFLFIDFKGGSGLGPLTRLPHCVGMLTDLASHEMDRTLVSLRAEVRHREELLASVQAPDLAAYRSTETGTASPLPHLVLIVDEFRMLVEDAPESLSELMRIATIGRSLGIHLIMATQRPQGALTADIRANVTTSIALRVQSEMESADIISSKVAADIPVGAPGRAYLSRGTEAPDEFQTASLSRSAAQPTGPVVNARIAIDALRVPMTDLALGQADPEPVTPAQAAAPIIASTTALWAELGGSEVRNPVARSLPIMLPYPEARSASDPDANVSGGSLVDLGWVDLPDEQRIAILGWNPARDGHLGMVGGPAGGVPDAMKLAVHQLMIQNVESHFYILDADSSFIDVAAHERVGAVAGLHELRRGVRVLERMAREMSIRLSRPPSTPKTPLVLVISGWGSWVSAFRAGPLMWAEDVVQDIVRDGSKAGITVILSGERELLTSRFFAAVPNRAYFPTGSSEDSRLAWPRLPGTAAVAGRAVVSGAFASGSMSVCQFFALPLPPGNAAINDPGRGQSSELATEPFRIEPLPTMVQVEDVLSCRPAPAALGKLPPQTQNSPITDSGSGHNRRLQLGLGGDDLSPVTVRLPVGSVLAVLGGPGSGKTSLLAALPALNPSFRNWLCPDSGVVPAKYWADTHANAIAGLIDNDAVVLADDADALSPATNQQLLDLHSMGWTVILTAGFSSTLIQRVPLALNARSHGTGILIAPRSLMDGDFFGLRFELETNPPPGRAVLISEGRATAVQLAAPAAFNARIAASIL